MATQALPSFLTASTLTTVIGGVTQTQVETVVVTSVLPTQQLPPYLSASTFTATVDGAQTIGTTLVELPLTYIGPSIPLGTNGVWTFLGSTTPASLTSTQASSSSSTAIPSSSTTQSTTTQASTISTSSSASSTSALTSTSSSSSSSNTSSGGSSSTESNPSSTVSSTSTPSSSSAAPVALGAAHHLSVGAIVGIAVAAFIVTLVTIMLIVLFCIRHRRRRRRYEHPNLSDFVLVESEGEGTRYAGEGSPRPTGEEEDSLLRGSLTTANDNDEMREIGPTARLVTNPSPTGTERTTGTTMAPEGVIPSAYKTPSSSPTPTLGPKLPSPFFHASASSLFFNPTRGPDRSLIGAAVGATKRDSVSTNDSSTSSPLSPAPTRNIIPPRQLMQMDDEWRQENHGGFGVVALHHGPSEIGERMHGGTGTPLRPPPALGYGNETTLSTQNSFLNSMRTMGSHAETPGSDDDERATLLMAHRFNMNESGGPTVLLHPGNTTDATATTPSSWHSSLGQGLQGLNVRLSRLSWFQRMDANRTHSPGSVLPTTATTRTRSGSPLRSVGTRSSLGVPPRPVSNLTTSSTGDTLFFDAPSGPSTMSTREGSRSRNGNGNGNVHIRGGVGSFGQRPTSMPPLPPRAMVTPTGGPAATNSAPQTPHPGFDNGSDGGSSFNQPALLFLDNNSSSSAPGSPRLRFSTPPPVPSLPQAQAQSQVQATPVVRPRPRTEPLVDILDTPVPARAAISPFSTTSTRGGPAVPPGLDIANIRSWRESSSDMPSSATFGSRSDHASGSGVNIDVVGGSGGDVLEEAPPLPRANWTQMRAVTVASTIESNRTRRAFGQSDVSDPYDDVHSSAGSLHSIPDRLSPLSPMGSGSNSRAPSRQYNSSSLGSNSNSSHHSLGPSPLGGTMSSAHGDNNNGTSGSSGSNLAHSNSITSDGQRRPRREPGEPLGLSPANSEHFRRARLSAIGGHRTPIGTPQRSPAADATFVQGVASAFNNEGAGTGTGTGALLGRTT